AAIGKVLWSSLNRGDDGLVRFLESIDADPTDDSTHRQARVLAVEVDKSQAYADKLRDVASRLGAQYPRAGSEVLLRLVRVLEEDVQDYAAAQAVCAEIETIGFHRPEAWIALSRIAKARGDQSAEATALERLVSSNDVTVPPPVRTDAMFNLAALKLHTVGETDGGVELLSQALEREPRYTQVGSLLRSVGSADNSSLMSLYGRVARSSTDSAVLLDFLEKRATRADATIDDAKEAIELAKSLEAFDRLEPLLERGVSLARESEGGLEAYLWIPKQLTERRLAVGDVDGALRWTRTAAESTSGEQATALWLNAANLAVQAGERDAARTVYERLFEEAPTDRRVWEPYLGVLRESGEEERFNDVISTVVDGLEDAGARNAVRMERARYLLGLEGREPDAAEVLREVLQDEPGHTDAAKLLAAVFERTGYDEELVDLLAQQLEVARGGDDTDTIRELSLKLGSILARVRRDDAMDVYRRALSALPHDRDLASALLEILPEDHDARERAETMERILRSETGDDAAALTLDLASRWEALGDSEALERTLELGYGAAPEDEAVRERLEGFYRTREDWGSLAGFLVREARRVTNPKVSVAFLRNAASLYLDRLGDATTAAEVLHEACEVAPEDAELVSELVSARVSAGALAQAAEEVSAALERAAVTDEMRAFLLRARGGVRLAMEDDDAAISDLEQAYVLGGASMGSELADGLLQVAERANARG
ncbi:MAG: hypothetical protein KC417_10320, partial [Myxococcales bacterium]|nr:hypothetical protein [Myxococcales bacterium]